MNHTAEEVRDTANLLPQIVRSSISAGVISELRVMLTAYAERIEADERATCCICDGAGHYMNDSGETNRCWNCQSQPIQPHSPDAADSGRVGETIVAGALFDLMGFLTARDEVTTLSACHEASPAVIALEAFAAKRGLQLDEANVDGWRTALAAQGQGEAVGEVFGPKAVSTMVALVKPLPPGTKLYTAPPASPAGVPNGWKLVPEICTDSMFLAGDCQIKMGAGLRGAWERMVANAPPAPEDAGGAP